MVKKIQRIALAAAGVLLAVALLEGALRVAGVFTERRLRPVSPAADGRIRIACFGDSFTYGCGAAAEDSYPAQLERLLNAGGPRFKVYNFGNPGQNTAQLRELLPDALDRVRPDAVVILCGMNNQWNFLGYGSWLKQSQPGTFFIGDRLRRLRVYRLGRIVLASLKEHTGGAARLGYRVTGRYDETIRALRKKADAEPRRADHFRELGRVFLDMRAYGEAENCFEKAISLEPRAATGYTGLGKVFQSSGRYLESLQTYARGIAAGIPPAAFEGESWYCRGMLSAEQWKATEAIVCFSCGIAADPRNGSNYRGLAAMHFRASRADAALKTLQRLVEIEPDNCENYNMMGYAHSTRGDYGKALSALERAIRLAPNKDYNYSYSSLLTLNADREAKRRLLETVRRDRGTGNRLFSDAYAVLSDPETAMSRTNRWMADDLAAILEICRRKKVRALLQTYPSGSYLPEDRVLAAAARHYSAPCVDHVAAFAAATRNGARRKEYFVPDGHCNARGYGLMAAELAKRLEEFFPQVAAGARENSGKETH